jgi:hypothetical protein
LGGPPRDPAPGEGPGIATGDPTPGERPVVCSRKVDCGWNVPPEEHPLMQAARAPGSAILRQPHASWACTSITDISKNKCAAAITTVERDMVGSPFVGFS